LSPDLAATRDGLRQTVLDLQRAILATKSCSTGCGPLGAFKVDPTRVFYAGISLGGILGSVAVAAADVKAAVVNVGGAGWADILENTETLAIRCQLVNGLIDAGVLMGEKWTGGATGLCTTDAWKAQAGYAQFSAIGRWVLDPADPANFGSKLGAKRFMIQEVVGDTVVPNIATGRLAAVSGVAGAAAPGDPFDLLAPAPSVSVATTPTSNKYIRYTSDAQHLFVHSSLLRPATAGFEGLRPLFRLQVDAATYLHLNK
jgi:hypothetical protein